MPKSRSLASLLSKVGSDPIEFMSAILTNADGTPFEPHEGQIALVRGMKPDTVIEAGRQWGKSMILAAYIVWWMLFYANRHVRIIAPTLDQARIIFNQVAWFFNQWPLTLMLDKKIVDFPFPEIKLKNGTYCHARGANSPQYIRGQPTDLVVEDEAAYIKDGVHPNVIEPLLTVTGKKEGNGIIRISTPFGQGDFRDGAVAAQRDQSGKMAYFHFTSLDNPHADKSRLYAIRDRYGADSLIWRVEYMAETPDADLSIFHPNDIKWAYENYPGYSPKNGSLIYPLAPAPNDRYVQGVDLANMRDYFVATVLNATDPTRLVQVRHDRMQQRGYAVYKGIVRSNYGAYHNAKTLIDATSLGESVVEDLQDIDAEGYVFTNASKYDAVHNLVRLFNERRIVIPFIRELVDELRFFEYEITPAKKLKMEARQGHDDYVMSLSLAGVLASRQLYTGFFMGVDFDEMGNTKPPKFPDNYDPFAED